MLTKDDELVKTICNDYKQAGLKGADLAMLDYARKLTLHPSSMAKADIKILKDIGFSDAAILDICQIASYFNFVNRLADGLGVELENYWQKILNR